jgi:hypothetical protein
MGLIRWQWTCLNDVMITFGVALKEDSPFFWVDFNYLTYYGYAFASAFEIGEELSMIEI